jgi:xylulokinase
VARPSDPPGRAEAGEAVLAVDLGTTRVKAAVVALDGAIVGSAEGGYPILHSSQGDPHSSQGDPRSTRADPEDGEPGRAEQDAGVWWDAAREAMRTAIGRARIAPGGRWSGRPGNAAPGPGLRVVAACIGGQGPSIVAVDESGLPLTPAIIWMDRRAEKERTRLAGRIGRDLSPYSSVPKVMWLRARLPDAYRRARWILQSWDFIAFRMTGSAVSSTFQASSPVFPADLLEAAELDPACFPREIVMGEVGGTLRDEVARDLGLDPGIPVVGGVNDSTASIFGAGIVRKGLAIDYGGTSGGLGLAWDSQLAAEGITSWPAPAPGLYIAGGGLAAAGRSFVWLLDTFGYSPHGATPYGPTSAPAARPAGGGPQDEWGRAADAALADAGHVKPGADGLVFLPYLAGERTPLWDDRARGVLFGLRAEHGRAHIARAVLEGVAFSLRHVADVLREAGGRIDELRVTGGQSRGALWNRIKADVFGVPVTVPAVTEGALLGEAMLAAIGAGLVSDAVAAADRFVRIAERIEPDPTHAPVYAERYATYRELYPRLRDLMHGGAAD